MSNLANYPRQSAYKTTLAQPIDSSATTIVVKTAPSFSLSSGGVYAAISPNNSSLFEVVLITAVSGVSLTVTRGIATYEGGGSSAVAHSAGEEIIISDSWKTFDDIKTAINSKLDQDGGNAGSSFDLTLSGSDFRIRKDGNDMKLTDDNQSEVTLSQLASLSGVNDKVKVSSNDTTEDYLINKIVGGDGIATPTQVNDGSDEDISLAIDLATNPGLEFSSGQLKVKTGTAITLDASGVNVDVGTGANQVVQRGASGEYPSGDGGNITNTPLSFASGSGNTTSLLSTASPETIDITGLGFTPSLVIVYAYFAQTSGSTKSSYSNCMFNDSGLVAGASIQDANASRFATALSGKAVNDSGNGAGYVANDFDADGFSLVFTAVGSVVTTDRVYFNWIAFK